MSTLRQKYEQILGQPYAQGLLNMIRYGEGTSGESGYQTMFGGGKFDTSKGWKHPDRAISSGRYKSTAAGAYQFLTPTWNETAKKLGLTSMDPRSQDIAALYLADKRGALPILQKGGKLVDVMDKLAPEWASIPTRAGRSYYGQPVKGVGELAKAYEEGKKQVTPTSPGTQTPPTVAKTTESDTAAALLAAFKTGLLGQTTTQPGSLLLNSPLLSAQPMANPILNYMAGARSPYLDIFAGLEN
jgi:muramidase (phage lysozyme)